MRQIRKNILLLLLLMAVFYLPAQQKTYCNPINIDYGYGPIPNFLTWGKHRTSADPTIVNYKGDYYLFSTNQTGYWWSSDMLNWNFVSRQFLPEDVKDQIPNKWDDLCAPAAWVQGDSLCVFGSTYSRLFPIWVSTNPKGNEWSKAVEHFDIGGWDPAFFVDDDQKLYMYNGSSNVYPLYGIELDRGTFKPIGTRKELLLLDYDKIGWHRFGEHMDNTFLKPFMEGAWMTKHNSKYYLQWGGPGTEFSHYGDGVAVGDSPLGHFEHVSLPLSMKAGGFIRGAGHGATFTDRWGNYWHTSTMVINVKNNFERRIGIWPAGFDKDDVMYCNTAFGDYPHYIPDGKTDHLKSRFTGWMLLNYNKPVQVSSTLGAFYANNIVDENIKTYWSAKTAEKGEWLISDLGEVSTVHAVQINYADQDAEFMGKQYDIYHQYKVYYSLDGKKWQLLVDKSKNTKDVPHDYVELVTPVRARYLKMENIHIPTGKFAISGFRVFGFGSGDKPKSVNQFMALRGNDTDRRNLWFKWQPVEDAYAYNIYIGTEPDKLYNCVMVHNVNEYYYQGMDKTKAYYFAIESINENGTSEWVKTEAL
ncbi:family 43 glycosylhydrolase [Dysgonomonas sp. BGC7]|uniref:family 43 glycosylhydrolase n=1 Tax=Dysgonomonas sp. BGC7 TaxID=1658008 RepID=UPI00161E44CF|nr:family 43 glycosylhydrolase [Dysgonomonas sp. BGC7]MBD8389270.1 discoidin domain-containing protein [Dysgonomonas sp. BGC7]